MDRIVVSNVQKTFSSSRGRPYRSTARTTDRVEVLAGVDLAVRTGEFITLVGPSGSGKSVLLDVIGGLTEASAGEAFIDTTRVTKPDPKIAYVFQQYALFPWRTALENVEYALEVRGVGAAERRRKARHFLGLFGLGGLRGRYPSQLSGGMQQRVAIARALSPTRRCC